MPERKGNPSSGGVRIEVEGGVAVVTIDRPEVRNAIGFATVDELDAALDQVGQSDSAVLVVRGGGDRAFVSGGDLKELGAIRTHEDAVDMATRTAACPRPRRRLAHSRDRGAQRARARRRSGGRHRGRHPHRR